MFELYEIPPHIKPNWQVWYECVLPEDRQHAEKVIRCNHARPLSWNFALP